MMKYEKPDMEIIWLVSREVFMTQSTTSSVPGGDGGGFDNDDEPW